MKNYEIHACIRIEANGKFEALVFVKILGVLKLQTTHIKASDKKIGLEGIEKFIDRIIRKEKNGTH